MKSTDICYWCGDPATSREHVPPFGLFPRAHRLNLITVPSCSRHNEDTSKLDEKFRFYLQACAESPHALDDFDDRTMRGLRREQSKNLVTSLAKGSKKVVVQGEETLALQIDPTEQDHFFEKMVRGLYFHLFRKPLTGKVATASAKLFNPGIDYDRLFSLLGPHLSNPEVMIEAECKNPEIFQFRYARIRELNREAFCVVMRFYRSVEVIGLVAP